MEERRRRADDWRSASPIELPISDFHTVCKVLGYKPEDVMSVRMNIEECVVTFHDPAQRGMPTSVKHPVRWG